MSDNPFQTIYDEGYIDGQEMSESRIAELEQLLLRVQICMGEKRLPDELMADIRKATEAQDDG